MRNPAMTKQRWFFNHLGILFSAKRAGFRLDGLTDAFAFSLLLLLGAALHESRAAAVLRIVGGLGAGFVEPPPVFNAKISFAVVDLADITPGRDLWQYTYTVADLPLAANQGFSIAFDRSLFASLQSPASFVNGDWSVLTLQPDLALNANGLYDAQALVSTPSLLNTFTVTFVRLGTGTPGSQPFIIYDTNFATLAQGQTVSTPEPATATLLLGSLAWFCGFGRRTVRGGRRRGCV